MKKNLKTKFANNLDELSLLRNSVRDLTIQVNTLLKQIDTFVLENKQLRDENKRLKDIIYKNSANSSKPPSTDIGKKKKNNARGTTDKKPGGQRGHKGTGLVQVEKPDKTVNLTPKKCSCGYSFNGTEKKMNEEKRQVFDIPTPKVEVIEYLSAVYECPHCNCKHQKEFPESVKAQAQYGNTLKSFAVYLMNYQLLPYKRTSELFGDLYNLPISQGTLHNILNDYDQLLDGPIDLIKRMIINSETVHFDESGFYTEGGRDWIHVASTESLTYYHYHKSRGLEALKDAGILDYFQGTAVHDYWSTYYKYENCEHSLCNAHHLRDLQGIFDSAELEWAKEMKKLLSEMKIEVDKAKAKNKSHLPESICNELVSKFQELIDLGYKSTPLPKIKEKDVRGKQKRGKALCFLDRLSKRKNEILDFIFDFSKPFDNNQAERDIRMTKIKQKISGTFRNSTMARVFCRIRSFISTAIKYSQNVLQAISKIYNNEVFLLQRE